MCFIFVFGSRIRLARGDCINCEIQKDMKNVARFLKLAIVFFAGVVCERKFILMEILMGKMGILKRWEFWYLDARVCGDAWARSRVPVRTRAYAYGNLVVFRKQRNRVTSLNKKTAPHFCDATGHFYSQCVFRNENLFFFVRIFRFLFWTVYGVLIGVCLIFFGRSEKRTFRIVLMGRIPGLALFE